MPPNRAAPFLKSRMPRQVDLRQTSSVLEMLNRGDAEQARRQSQAWLKHDPGNSEAWHLAGLIAHRNGDQAAAIDCLSRAIRLDARNPHYQNNLGVVLRNCGRIAEALACYQAAVAAAPDFAEAHSNLGTAWRLQGNLEAAVESCRKAIRLAPNSRDGYFNLGLAYQAMGLYAEAIRAFRQVVQRDCDHHPAWYNLGAALLSQNRFNQAGASFERALALRPGYPEACNGLSQVRRVQKQLPEAIALAMKALDARPHYPEALAHLAVLHQQACRWDRLAEIEPALTAQTLAALADRTQPAETPLFSAGFRMDPEINHAVAAAWSRAVALRARALNQRFTFDDRLKRSGRITIGYLSSDFRDHPVAHQIGGLISAHDRLNFRIFCYSTGVNDGSPYRKHFERNCDKFLDIRNLQDPEAATQIYKDSVDILVDLNGHTAGNRLGICALRPSPIQATYLGFPGTSGADFFDYIITDRIVTPENHLAHYSERPVYMPASYMITDDSQPVTDRVYGRSEAGLPEDAFVFCCLNSPFKLDPILFDVWVTILKQVSGSHLWLPRGATEIMARLRREAAARGLDPGRLVFAPRLPAKEDYLARLRLADLALDTRTYNGHVSTCDALWAGVPVLAMLGTHFASRVSASILGALDMKELITGSLEEYASAAVQFANAPGLLQRLREKLARHRRTQPFFKTAAFVDRLEAAYREMWRLRRAGQRPRKIMIDAH